MAISKSSHLFQTIILGIQPLVFRGVIVWWRMICTLHFFVFSTDSLAKMTCFSMKPPNKKLMIYCWWFRNPRANHLGCTKPCKKWINYQPQVVLARFLNHQQYLPYQQNKERKLFPWRWRRRSTEVWHPVSRVRTSCVEAQIRPTGVNKNEGTRYQLEMELVTNGRK